MALILSICFSIFFGIIKSFNNDIVTFAAYTLLFVVSGTYDVILIKGFINKTFECLVCGQNFKPKWYKLMFTQWRQPRKYRAYKELNSGTFEQLIYKCPECKNRECIAK